MLNTKREVEISRQFAAAGGRVSPARCTCRRHPQTQRWHKELGIPCVVDRLIQLALLQQLTPIFDPLFRTTATAFVRTEALTTPSKQPVPMWRRVTVGAWS